MFYEDLSPYRYSATPTGLPGVFNVGWLSTSVPYTGGNVRQELSRKLAEMAKAQSYALEVAILANSVEASILTESFGFLVKAAAHTRHHR